MTSTMSDALRTLLLCHRRCASSKSTQRAPRGNSCALDKADRVTYLEVRTRQDKPRSAEVTMRILAVEDEPEYLEMLRK